MAERVRAEAVVQLFQQRQDRRVAHGAGVEVGVRDLAELDVQLGARPGQERHRTRFAEQADQGERHVAADAELRAKQRPDPADQGMGAHEHGVLRCLPHMI